MITVYQYGGTDGTTPTPLDTVTLGNLVGHEIGHTLGLNEDACPNGIMNRPIPASPIVTDDECNMVDQLNQVKVTGYVEPPDGCADPECTVSPVIINFGPGGYELTGISDGVQFDINGDGVLDQMGWTVEGLNEAFLWLDRNGNGLADSGTELFGDHTALSTGILAANGFEALREFDSNDDGVLDSRDSVWPFLLLWFDRNHDGTSQPEEILHVSQSSLESISLDYSLSRRFDSNGNMFRYRSLVAIRTPSGACVMRAVYDVYLVADPGAN